MLGLPSSLYSKRVEFLQHASTCCDVFCDQYALQCLAVMQLDSIFRRVNVQLLEASSDSVINFHILMPLKMTLQQLPRNVLVPLVSFQKLLVLPASLPLTPR